MLEKWDAEFKHGRKRYEQQEGYTASKSVWEMWGNSAAHQAILETDSDRGEQQWHRWYLSCSGDAVPQGAVLSKRASFLPYGETISHMPLTLAWVSLFDRQLSGGGTLFDFSLAKYKVYLLSSCSASLRNVSESLSVRQRWDPPHCKNKSLNSKSHWKVFTQGQEKTFKKPLC